MLDESRNDLKLVNSFTGTAEVGNSHVLFKAYVNRQTKSRTQEICSAGFKFFIFFLSFKKRDKREILVKRALKEYSRYNIFLHFKDTKRFGIRTQKKKVV